VSVVIAAYDEADRIGACLDSLRGQAGVREVIVVDDGSRDATAAVSRERGARVIGVDHHGPAKARNIGVERAAGELIVFFDADMTASPGFVERLVAPIRAGRALGTFSREIALANPENRWAAAYGAIRGHPTDQILPREFPDRWGNYRAIRREDFIAAGGYDDVGYGGDMTLAPKLGEDALVAPGAACAHFNPDSLSEICSNARWHGRGAAIEWARHPWLGNTPPAAVWKAITDIRAGRTPWVLPARLAFHTCVLVGLIERRLFPSRRPYR